MSNVKALLKKSEENIKASEILVLEGLNGIAMSRIYYAMFYIAEALLLFKDLSYSSHKAVISAFGKEYTKRGIFETKFHKLLLNAFEFRQDADYQIDKMISKKEVEEFIKGAKEFLSAAKKYLED